MISRRDLLASGVGAGAVMAPHDVGAAPPQTDEARYFNEMILELRQIRRAVSIEGTQAITNIRAAQRTYLKNSSRFPEFIDVGYDVFQSVVDWLIAVRQPVTISRLGGWPLHGGAVCVDDRATTGFSGQLRRAGL